MSAVNVRYGLYPGDRLMVSHCRKEKEESNCSKGVPVPYSDGLGKVQVQRKQDRCVYR